MERPSRDDDHDLDGLTLPQRHAAIVFGDGGSLKSYLALRAVGTLAQRGVKVGYFDWELTGEDHRDRLERLFGASMPLITYLRCERPLVDEVDRLRRIRQVHDLAYVVYDSLAFACDGPPTPNLQFLYRAFMVTDVARRRRA